MTSEAETGHCPQCGKSYPSNVRICPDDGAVLERGAAGAAEVGTVLDGKYRLDAFLSHGGMGGVYRATHVMLDKTVAVKLINPELVTSPEIVRRFQREARAATALSHPNIVAVYDLGQTPEGTLYIAMEFVDGPTLKSVIQRGGPMPPARIVAILRQLASALAVAHAHSVIHRDLKPQNVMLTGQDVAKLVDFGIAKTFDEGTQLTVAGFTPGTPQYMSPEQAEGRVVDPRSDIYSLGVIAYEMITGDVPFSGDSMASILIKHMKEAPVPPSLKNTHVTVPPALEALTMRCLEKDPAARFQSAEELGRALDGIAETLPTAIAAQATMATRPSAQTTTPQATAAPTVAASGASGASKAAVAAALAPPVPPAGVSTVAGPPAAATSAPTVRAPQHPGAPAAVAPGTHSTAVAAAVPAAASVSAAASVPPKTSNPMVMVAVVVVLIAAGAGWSFYQSRRATASATAAASTGPAPTATPAMALPPPAAPESAPPAPGAQATAPGPTTGASPTSAPAREPVADAPPSTQASAPATTATSAAGAAPSAPTASAVAAPVTAAPAAPAGAAPQAAPAAPPAVATIPQKPAIFFQCAGAPEVCSPLRAAMDDAVDKAGYSNVREPGRADITVVARVDVLQERIDRQFQTTFAMRNYSIEVSGDARTGDTLSMPPARNLSFDSQFGAERASEASRALASDVVDRIKTFVQRKRGG